MTCRALLPRATIYAGCGERTGSRPGYHWLRGRKPPLAPFAATSLAHEPRVDAGRSPAERWGCGCEFSSSVNRRQNEAVVVSAHLAEKPVAITHLVSNPDELCLRKVSPAQQPVGET